MAFFKQFPTINVDINHDGIIDVSTDLWRYVDIIDEFADDSFAYQKIRVPNEVRPDQLSHQLYGSPDFYWTFFVLNDFLKGGGINAWAKGDTELQTFMDDAYSKYAVMVFPPVEDPTNAGEFPLIDGMPINNPDYKDQLYLLHDLTGTNDGTYVAAKIVYWDHNRYQLWVDKTQLYIYTPVAGGTAVGPDSIVKTDDYFEDFFSVGADGYKAYHVRYLDNPQKILSAGDSDSDVFYEDSDDSETLAANQLGWESDVTNLPNFSDSEAENLVYSYQIFTDAQKAPHTYSGFVGSTTATDSTSSLSAAIVGAYRVLTLSNSQYGVRYYLAGTASLPFVDGGTRIGFYNSDNTLVTFLEGNGDDLVFKRINSGETYSFYQTQAVIEPIEVLSPYDALSLVPTYDDYISYEDNHIAENDNAREVRVLRPDRIREFAKEFNGLLNR